MSDKINCHKCHFENQASAKFCSNCGSELTSQENICKSCGFANRKEANYCASCGSKLSRKARNKSEGFGVGESPGGHRSGKKRYRPPKSERRGSASKKAWNPVIIGALLVGFFIIYLLIDGSKQSTPNSPGSFQPTVEKKTNNLALENQVYEVASKFVCSCASCGEEPLETCSCQTAQQERQFIREALQQGQSVDKVITAVNMNYGWIKDEYKSKYGNGKLSLDTNSKLNDLVAGETTDQGIGQIATFADRGEIISHFACNCGQCDLDELKDCDCDHPGGAKEVKQFIDEKIKRGIYATDKIIEFVEHKYASRIR